MKEQFVTYPIAKKLKELGFNEPCFGHFLGRELSPLRVNGYKEGVDLLAPLWQQAIDWFRKEKKIIICINYWTPYACEIFGHNNYETLIFYKSEKGADWNKYYKNYNTARENAILKAISLLEEKK